MDWSELPGWVGDAGAAAFIGMSLVIAVMRGWLVPRMTLDTIVGVERARADEWRTTAQAAEVALGQAMAQNAVLLAQFDTHTQLLRSIKEQAARRRDEG